MFTAEITPLDNFIAEITPVNPMTADISLAEVKNVQGSLGTNTDTLDAKIKGMTIDGNSFKWNQLCDGFERLDFQSGVNDRKYANNTITLISTHKYVMLYEQLGSLTSAIRNTPCFQFLTGEAQYKSGAENYELNSGKKSWFFTPTKTGDARFQYWGHTPSENYSVVNVVVIDLTEIFGQGNEPTTVDDPRIAFLERVAEKHPQYDGGSIKSIEEVNGDTVGRNLFDKTNATIDFYVSSDGYYKASSYERSAIVNVKPNTQYTFSETVTNGLYRYSNNIGSQRIRIGYFSELPQENEKSIAFYSATDTINVVGTRKKLTTISPPNAKYAVVFFMNCYGFTNAELEELIDTITISIGVSDVYTPYQHSEATLPITLRSCGTVHDTLDIDKGEWVQRVGVYHITESNYKNKYSEYYYFDLPRDAPKPKVRNDQKNAMTSNGQSYAYGYGSNAYFFDTVGTMIYGAGLARNWATENDLKSWLRDNPYDIYYELETPIIHRIDTTDFKNLRTYYPQTTVSVTDQDGNDVGCDFYVTKLV